MSNVEDAGEVGAWLDSMRQELAQADGVFRASGFWEELNRINESMLLSEGLSNFKRTVSQNYFNWLIADRSHPFHSYVRRYARGEQLFDVSVLPEMNHLRLVNKEGALAVTADQIDAYREYVCHVWSVMEHEDASGVRHVVEEPLAGNPFPVRAEGRILSQDLATSIIECNTVRRLLGGKQAPVVAELGAGYGRLAHVCASALPGLYCIFDIPPALGIAQYYLTEVFGSEQIFQFRSFDDFEAIRAEVSAKRVALFTPNQLKQFPDGFFDIVLSISTLPEMRPDQVRLYLSEFSRLSSRGVYLKQWSHWKNPVDGTFLPEGSYELDDEWVLSARWQDPIIPDFFNRVWTRREAARSSR
jgi:putative sugar O-methyltransferase